LADLIKSALLPYAGGSKSGERPSLDEARVKSLLNPVHAEMGRRSTPAERLC
jgi:hypothetical protein